MFLLTYRNPMPSLARKDIGMPFARPAGLSSASTQNRSDAIELQNNYRATFPWTIPVQGKKVLLSREA
jgi:hypothetical protein